MAVTRQTTSARADYLAAPWPSLRRALALLLAVGAGSTPGTGATTPAVEVELFVPPAATHVIGDPIPLEWRFKNVSAEPLAFMWEGCCRLNGRLTVSAAGLPVHLVPPGQALAHMFAKAERLEPGRPASFDTRLSDWVRLEASGTYRLQGRYTGVLPEQQPQVPRGLALWRDAATTPPLTITLLDARDYLAQRESRSARRELRLDLAGPHRLPPLQPAVFQLGLVNTAAVTNTIVWPEALQFWVVGPDGQRLAHVPTGLDGAYAPLALPPRARVERTVSFDPGRLEGVPFGDYTLFIDLAAAGDAHPRLPSNPLPLRWDLTPRDVEELLRQAAGGPRLGLRNAPLKLLRVYVAEVQPVLERLDPAGLPAAARALRDQLLLAGCLKPFAPKPGRVDLPLVIPADGVGRFRGPLFDACGARLTTSPGATALATFEGLFNLRRHLGWDLALNVQPAADTSLRQILAALAPFDRFAADLGAPARALFEQLGTPVPLALTFRAQPVPASVLLRLAGTADGVSCAIARVPVAARPLVPGPLFRPEEIPTAAFTPLPDRAALAAALAADVAAAPQILVVADPGLTWGAVRNALEPLRAGRLSADLCLAGP